MLLMIGYLTTPTSAAGVSLSEFWAWVRYLAAVTNDSDMRLTRSFANLDAHQKTILSDDFGMGVPMLWLSEKLSLELIVDGRYFMDKFATSVGTRQKRAAKRGPNKTPDFVARDIRGRWHIIECKGTQSGTEYSSRQLGVKGPPATGGVAQKSSIKFPPNHTGQRLACGLSIGIEEKSESILRIVDPVPEDPVEIGADDLGFAADAATRGVMSRVLRMAGFEVAAETIASPWGRRPDSTPRASRKAESERQEMVKERDGRARTELHDLESHRPVFGRQFRGRELTFDLPREILVEEQPVTRVIVRQGINREALDELALNPTIDEVVVDNDRAPWTRFMGQNTVSADGLVATMNVGGIFRSEMILQTRGRRR